jgi:hypothetical protein
MYAMLRALDIQIDGLSVGSLKPDNSFKIEISDNAQTILGKMDWGRTKPFSLSDCEDGDVISFQGYFSPNPFVQLGLMGLPFHIDRSKTITGRNSSA